MKLTEIYKNENKPAFSIEIFPPKADNSKDFLNKKAELFEELNKIKENCNPSLVSVTYGAGGSNREKSYEIVEEIFKNLNFKATMPHFTCVCSSKDYIEKYLDEIETLGIENILALRGDEPKDINVCYKDFAYASELVHFIKSNRNLEIAVAGYPEGHIGAKSFEDDIQNLKRKVENGANVIFTQLFFENEKFYRYVDILEKNGINIPTVAGILPVISHQGLSRMVDLSGIKLSCKAQNFFEKYKNSKEDTIKAGIEWAGMQTEDLLHNGVCGIHFYTLNKSRSVVEIFKGLGLN